MVKKTKVSNQDEVTTRVEEAIKRYQDEAAEGKRTMRFSSGVEVKLLRLPPLLVQRVDEQFKDPDPPMVEVEVHGKKETQPNPDDPDYAKQLKAVKIAKGWAYMTLVLLKGVEVKMPKDEEWLEELRLAGVEVGDTRAAKKLAYIQSVVITEVSELEEVAGRVLAMSGVTPQAVDEASKTVSG